MRTFHPCSFQFKSTNIRRVGSVTDGGTSLSGISDKIESDGGGYLQADFTNGTTRTKAQGNAWRAITDGLGGGATAIIVMLCAERLFQPVGAMASVPHSDSTPFDDGSLYSSGGADYTATAPAALRATSMTIAGTSELPLIGGELFSILHETWGWRAYRINAIDGATINFLPPLREAIAADTQLEFDTPRCQMRLAQATENPTEMGRFTACSASFVEDMRQPA
jgi:hypothetical protein